MMKKWIFGAASAALLASGLFFSCANSDDYDDETTKEEIVSLATLVGGSYSFTAGTATHTLSFVSETEATYAIPAYNIFQYFTYTAEESGSNEYTLKMYAHEEGETVDTATTTAEARSYVITINSFSEILIGTTTASLASPTDLIGKSYSFTAGPSTHILSFASNTELAYSMTGSWGGASYIFTYKTLVNSDGSYTFSMYQHYADTEADLTASANRTSTITINDDSTILIGTTSASLYTDYASLGSTLYAGSCTPMHGLCTALQLTLPSPWVNRNFPTPPKA